MKRFSFEQWFQFENFRDGGVDTAGQFRQEHVELGLHGRVDNSYSPGLHAAEGFLEKRHFPRLIGEGELVFLRQRPKV